jgi:hypothetical protein
LDSAVPTGTLPICFEFPALKRWAIINRDSRNPRKPLPPRLLGDRIGERVCQTPSFGRRFTETPYKILPHPGAPAAVEEAFDGREKDFVGEKADDDDDEHDADDLVHGVQLPAVVQEMAEAEPC